MHRLDPSAVDPDALDALSGVLTEPDPVALTREGGPVVELPAPLVRLLVQAARLVAEGRTVALVAEDEAFTTQAAADFLGVSRQHLVDLLEDGAMPFHRVGTHRRVLFRDLVTYEKQRAGQRRAALSRLARDVDEAGLYDGAYTGDDT
jgi:excisionase family DNA binding protein